MRRKTALVLVSTVLAVVLAPIPAGGVGGFGDVATDRFYTAAIQWMVDGAITAAYVTPE